VIHDEGTASNVSTARTSGHVSGPVYGQGGTAFVTGTYGGTTTTTNTSRTNLAARCSPPASGGSPLGALVKSIIGAILAVVALAVGVVIAGETGFLDGLFGARGRYGELGGNMFTAAVALTLALILLAGFVVGFRRAWRTRSYNRDVYPQALARWQRSWLCMMCGKGFEAEE
jgi:hypothetical protein